MGRAPAYLDFQMQAAVVGGNHGVGKAGADRQVWLCQSLIEQPFRPDLAARLLVIREMQFDGAGERHAGLPQRLEGKQIGGEVGFGDRGAAPVHPAVFYFGAVGVAGPALAGRHHVAVGIERDAGAVSKRVPNDQIGGRYHADRLHGLLGHGMALYLEPQRLDEFRRAVSGRATIAGRIVRRQAHKFSEKFDLRLATGLDQLNDLLFTHLSLQK